LIGNSAPVTSVTATAKVDRPIQTDNTNDRDANGQELYEKQQNKEKMSDEQFEKALALLREKNFIKDMNWVVVAVYENNFKFALVQDLNGQTIRKIVEYELWDIFEESEKEQTKGRLLKRTA